MKTLLVRTTHTNRVTQSSAQPEFGSTVGPAAHTMKTPLVSTTHTPTDSPSLQQEPESTVGPAAQTMKTPLVRTTHTNRVTSLQLSQNLGPLLTVGPAAHTMKTPLVRTTHTNSHSARICIHCRSSCPHNENTPCENNSYQQSHPVFSQNLGPLPTQ